MMMLKVVLLVSCAICYVSMAAQDFTKTGYGNNLYARKTSYFWFHPVDQLKQDALYTVTMGSRTCSAVQFNMYSRHGARYITAGEMEDFTSLQQKLIPLLGNDQFDFIRTWINTYPRDKGSLVTELGLQEMRYLGSKYGRELFTLFQNGGINRIKLSATQYVRTQTSAAEFLRYLSTAAGSVLDPAITPTIRDDVLMFYNRCKKLKQMQGDPAFRRELVAFQQGPEADGVLQDAKQRLQLSSNLTLDDAKLMYLLCATELAINNQSEWCTLQSDQNREVLEYEKDLEDYYARLYGMPTIERMTCPLLRDMFTELDAAIKEHSLGQNFTSAVLQVGHFDALVHLYAALGLFRDTQPLRADNFMEMKNRKFVDAKVAPFSGHLAFILYNCGGTSVNDYAIQLLVNGKPTDIPACSSSTCWYRDVRAAFRQAVDMCDFDAVCAVGSTPVG